MQKGIYLLKKNRRFFLHSLFVLLYLIMMMAMNWDFGDMRWNRIFAVLLIGATGISIAYQTRYSLILLFRLGRTLWGLLLFFGSLTVLGLLGYLLFHGLDNRLAEGVVDTTKEHPLKDYIFVYLHWYFSFAKFGAIFFAFDQKLFQFLDKLFAADQVKNVPQQEATADQLVAVPAKAISLFRQASALLGFPANPDETAFVPQNNVPVVEEEEPEHVTINWILDFLNVGRSTFYRCIRNKILFEVRKIGNRPYYLKKDVTDLMRRHEKGSWTFSKYLKEIQKKT